MVVAKYRVAIDAGHGGKDPGAVGHLPDGRELLEKDFNLIFAKKLADLCCLEKKVVPVLIRNTDAFVALGDRVKITVAEKADVFVSIHCNSSEAENPFDCQVYYYSDDKDKDLAGLIFEEVDKVDGVTSRWSRIISANFSVLKGLGKEKTAAVLIEVGFISNPRDVKLLNNPEFQKTFCLEIYDGIKKYLKI